MQAAQLNTFGHRDIVVIKKNLPRPKLSSDKVLVKVFAAGLNPFDWKLRQGRLKESVPITLPTILGSDFSGIVVKAGKKASGFKAGDEVYGNGSILSGGTGAFAEYLLADPNKMALKPKKFNFLQSAALPLVAASAWQALVDYMGLHKGQKILIHGGAGGIGSIAIQLANYLGAYVATTVRGKDINYAIELGADEVINYQTQPFENLIRHYDAVLDTAGGQTYNRSFQVLNRGGMIVSMIEKPRQDLMDDYDVNAIAEVTDVTTERLTKIAGLIDEGVIKININRSFSLEETSEALTYQERRHPTGKVVLQIENNPFAAKIKNWFSWITP